MSLKDDILGAIDYNLKELYIEEWKTTVYIKPLSGAVRNRLIQDVKNNKDLDKIQVRVLINSICDSEGKLIFNEQDIIALGNKNCEVLSRIENVCCEVSGLNEKGKEEIEKNL